METPGETSKAPVEVDRSSGKGAAAAPVRLLFAGAGGTADDWSAALEREGLECRIAAAEARAVRERLRDPLDGIVAWDDEAGERAASVVAASSSSGPAVPVVVVAHPGSPRGALRALAAGAVAVLDRDHPERLPAVVRRALREAGLVTREALAGRIAHELNNTLAPIPLAAQLLRGTLGRPEAAAALESQLDAVDQAGRSSMRSVRDLSELLTASVGAPLRVRAKHLLAIAAQHWREVPDRAAGVLVEYPPDLPAVRLTVPRVLQVLACLARRSLDRTGGGELLFLGREGEGGDVELHVRCGPPGSPGRGRRTAPDSGGGVPAGADHGLAEVHRAVEEEGGRLRVLEGEGGCSGFVLLLPPAAEAGRAGRRGP